MFTLHRQLAADTVEVARLDVSWVLLSRDANYPWFILVPAIDGAREFHHLDAGVQQKILLESAQLASAIERIYRPDKLNIAALGNVVPQLHIHHIARFATDAAWPAPVWGKLPPKHFAGEELAVAARAMATELKS